MYVHKRPVYNMVSLRLEPKGEIREIYLELQKCICTFLPHICGAEQIVSLALVLRNMSRPPSRPALTRALCLLSGRTRQKNLPPTASQIHWKQNVTHFRRDEGRVKSLKTTSHPLRCFSGP